MKYEASSENMNKAPIGKLQEYFGERPGNYTVDKYYFRTSIGNKPYYWDEYTRKWRILNHGMDFDFDVDGIMVRVDE